MTTPCGSFEGQLNDFANTANQIAALTRWGLANCAIAEPTASVEIKLCTKLKDATVRRSPSTRIWT
ncbi:hypothetical protein [Arthrobacter sp. B10-11]|uniref:hypothetical protein n=1 Tax=Arthrobacter sp. B10-11 TaxID=3081160 RepID=UPI0029557339|nr:hypothetical protein [Arthrobacter sp. B10-11]MDV8148424.1 hypothetical protein [Arthrobacter sp. B10-11]